MSGLPATGRAIAIVALLAYPAAVFFLLDAVGALGLGLLLVALALLRAGLGAPLRLAAVVIAGAAYLALLASADGELVLKLYPAIVSIVLLAVFAWSLANPPSMVERLARRSGMTVSARGIGYMRAVTKLWCAFFALNAIASLAVTLAGSLEAWAFYNGFLSYVLIGALFGAEYLYRRSYRRRAQRGGA